MVESVRIEKGQPLNIAYHNDRMMKSLYDLFSLKSEINLEEIIRVPYYARAGTYKCRILYDKEIRQVEFLPYKLKEVSSLKIIEDNEIRYDYKFADRRAFEKLLAEKGNCDDILIVKNGKVTDSSYANVILKDTGENWVTPKTFLLPGTMRASLLKSGLIKEREITIDKISDYTEIKLINAMIGIYHSEGIPVYRIEK